MPGKTPGQTSEGCSAFVQIKLNDNKENALENSQVKISFPSDDSETLVEKTTEVGLAKFKVPASKPEKFTLERVTVKTSDYELGSIETE